MLTSRAALLAFAVLGLALAASLQRSWALAVASLALAVPLVASLVLAQRSPKLEASRTGIPTVALAGDTACVSLALTNTSLSPALFVVEDEWPEGVAAGEANGELSSFIALAPGERIELASTLVYEEPGRRVFSRTHLALRAPFGVASREVSLYALARTTVHPASEPAPAFDGFGKRRRSQLGPLATRRAGTGSEFYGLRPYQPGDGLDVVNWRATARLGRPIVNEFEPEVPADIVLLLDAREDVELVSSLRAARALAERFLADRNQVSLLAWGSGVTWVHPGAGPRQRDRILDALLDVAPAGHEPLSRLATEAPPQILPTNAHVLVLTPASENDGDLPAALERLALRCERVVVLSPSPVALDGTPRDDARGRTAAALAALERARRLAFVRERGVEVHDWDPSKPLALLDTEAR